MDLAGSERQKKTGASGSQLKEGAMINQPLGALGQGKVTSLSCSRLAALDHLNGKAKSQSDNVCFELMT